ncbi:prolyl oligopeptidase-like protein [Lindgomyces ingoldianus]|uniref:Prolyl oligopeptidase-like protein n=1 Tax=Lindgomyces ingoldianus TaxID=673940 RepID=A0ACB6QRF2_9PLEO|nr:prolyl oligopeptidase-like protein [Lindgomyces ingoldianus]KAF2469558.1 prolyl oligopeptidase-like protein [Lindgomyces ingoldianus]
MHRFFKSEFFNFEFLRILSTAPYGGCEIGDALVVASRINDCDAESWSQEWADMSSKAEALAEEAQSLGDTCAARGAFLRAANYSRASQYMLSNSHLGPDLRVLQRLEKSRDLFKRGIALLEIATAHPLSIPFKNEVELLAYLYIPNMNAKRQNSTGRYPLVIILDGGDSTQEEMFIACGLAGLARGYAILTFDGPGQGILLKRDKVPMEPAYEKVTSTVLDYVEKMESSAELSHLSVDLDRVAVVGHSLGAYFALRSCVDLRIKACIAIDPSYDMWDLLASRIPAWLIEGWSGDYIPDGVLNSIVRVLQRLNFQMRWEVEHMLAIMGAESPAQAIRNLRKFSLRLAKGEEYLSEAQCAILVSGAAKSMYFDPTSDTRKVFEALGHLDISRKECWIADSVEQGGLSAKIAAFELANHRIFTWCDRHIGLEKVRA